MRPTSTSTRYAMLAAMAALTAAPIYDAPPPVIVHPGKIPADPELKETPRRRKQHLEKMARKKQRRAKR